MTQLPEHIGTPPAMRNDNGILAHVPGQYVGRAQMWLPDAALFPHDEVSVEVDAGWLGRVRLIFRKYRYSRPKAKAMMVAWSCRYAERLTPEVAAGAVEASGEPAERPALATSSMTASHARR